LRSQKQWSRIRKISFVAAAFLSISTILHCTCVAQITIEQPRVESLVNPSGIDTLAPRLSWQLHSDTRGVKQSAYQVLVASSAELLATGNADLWDSGKVPSDQSINVIYAGKTLMSDQTCYWKVRAWDQDGQPISDSAAAQWGMGLLDAGDWKAKWIGLDSGDAAD
jgi:alpha-L-rhamnosidase